MDNMEGIPRKPAGSILAVNYVVALVLFGSLHFVAPSVTANFRVSASSELADWLMTASVMASTWAIWLIMVRQRCVNNLGLWRLLRADLGAVDTLVHNAGNAVWGDIESLSPRDFEDSWRVNTLGLVHTVMQLDGRIAAALDGYDGQTLRELITRSSRDCCLKITPLI